MDVSSSTVNGDATGGDCSNNGCPFKTTGQCLEGLVPGECPNRTMRERDPEENPEEDIPSRSNNIADLTPTEYRSLPPGSEITLSEAGSASCNGQPIVVFTIGQVRSGKTTLFAEIFKHLHQDVTEEILFRGSVTLPAFLDLWQLATIESGLDQSETGRTLRAQDFSYLNLNLCCAKGDLSLFLANASGEIFFDALLNLGDPTKQYDDLTLGNYYLIVYDGEKLSTLKDRYGEEQEMIDLLDRLRALGYLNQAASFAVAVLKYDVVQEAGPQAMNHCDSVVARLRQRYPILLQASPYLKISARPKSTTHESPNHPLDVIREIAASVPTIASSFAMERIVPNRELAMLANYEWAGGSR
jgi:hypothetical protein